MRGYTYKIHKPGADWQGRSGGQQAAEESGWPGGGSALTADSGSRRYGLDELEAMTLHQLRRICHEERLVKGVVEAQDRGELIRTIMKYRGASNRLFISAPREGGAKRIEEALHRYLNSPQLGAESIQVPAKLTLYAGLRLDGSDGYMVHTGSAAGLGESNVLIVNERDELCGIMNLVQDELKPGRYELHADKQTELKRTSNRNYSLLFFRKQDSEYLYKAYYSERPMPPTNLHYWRLPVAELDIRELEETEAVLAIDFGTSNTTAGAYLDHGYISSPNRHDVQNGSLKLGAINYVSFADGNGGWIEMLPTAIGVTDCSDPSAIEYCFGDEALRQLKKNGYASRASVFLGMKRWVNGVGKREELTDIHGNTATVKRGDIIRAYLLHVIETAQHRFKCRFQQLHFTAPVKLKEAFMDMFADILPEYAIDREHAIDEGMAVLYNTIADQIEQNRYVDGELYDALIIDCGGGTTDLSSCRFRIEEGRISYKIDIRTAYENGDTRFGGNNLTYRVMQYMKIVFADYYAGSRSGGDIDELIGVAGADLFRHVDEHGADDVYRLLDERYAEAERVLPTRFQAYENRTGDEYWRVRRNFYFMWELAEAMKVAFFRRTGIVRRIFQAEGRSRGSDTADNDLHVTPVERWTLSLRGADGRLADRHDSPEVVFTVNEMNKLLKSDIYAVISKFLDPFYVDGRIQQYRILKLTGQSCRIDVFREALKEFVPGRSIEFKQRTEDAGKVPDLKLSCLRGAIRYMTARKLGQIEAAITRIAPVVPFTVTAYTHHGREKVLISSMEQLSDMRGGVSRPMAVAEVEFYLQGGDDRMLRKYVYKNDASSYKPVLYEEIAAMYGEQIPQEETDTILNGEAKFFVVTSGSGWGFYIVPVARENEQLRLGEKRLFTFEDDLSELDFFDGMK
ncbi:molecular chaperone [Paenibacillus sp. NPDC058071]|uniref:molecular chaperone n=1 Tax=Paenibacillus sp. NPDC058071 TaxID=3346326 RepID=UPI0036DC6CA3